MAVLQKSGVLAVCALVCIGVPRIALADIEPAAGLFVQFQIPANADVVANGPDSGPPSVSAGIDSGGSSFLSQSEAWARDSNSNTGHGIGYGDGLPDDGRIGNIQLLPYNQANVARREGADYLPILIDNPNYRYNSITLYATLGSNTGYTLIDAPVTATLHYTTGADLVTTIRVPDWFQDPAGVAYLINNLDRTYYTGGPLDIGLQDANDPAIFAMPITTDASRILSTITLVKADGTGILNLFAASGDAVAVPEPASLGYLAAVALLVRRTRSRMRRECR